jgi:glucose 1-dehydrogenase
MNVIITGAASGIGRAVAAELIGALAGGLIRLLLIDRDADALAATARQLEAGAATIDRMVEDLADDTAFKRIADRARDRFSEGLDVLVSNAGTLSNAPLAELPEAHWDRDFAVNTRATWMLAKRCHPLLRQARGCIVATASLSASQPTPPHGAYSASKAALVMLVRQLAHEWGPDGIRCNCVSPGMIHTGLTDSVYSDAGKRDARASNIPLRRVGTPEDVARVIAFLASPAAAYVTGVDIAVDGGVGTSLMPVMRGAAVPDSSRRDGDDTSR